MRLLILGLLLVCPAAVALAREAPSVASDPVMEARLMRLSSELRCLVCQNESLADSHADLAVDLRNQIRDQMKSGKSDAQIKAWLTQRYGDFVLYRPPVKATTWLLWLGPFLLLVAALAGLVFYLRIRGRRVPAVSMTSADHAQAEALLSPDTRKDAL